MSVNNNIIRNSTLVQAILSPEFDAKLPAKSKPVSGTIELQEIKEVLDHDDFEDIDLNGGPDDSSCVMIKPSDSAVINPKTIRERTPARSNTEPSSASTQETIDKQKLTGRVKKLNQSERRALMKELKHIDSLLHCNEEIKPADLREKGLCVLLQAGDGLPIQPNRVITSFLLGICNIFWRVSSASLVEKLTQVRGKLKEKEFSYTKELGSNRVMNRPIKDYLEDRIVELESEQKQIDDNGKIVVELQGELKELWDDVIMLKELCEKAINVSANDQSDLIPILVKIGELLYVIKDERKDVYMDLSKKLITAARFLEQDSKLMQSLSPEQRDTVSINLAVGSLREAYQALNKELNNVEQQKVEIKNEIQAINKRLDKLKRNWELQEARADCEDAFNAQGKAELLWRASAMFTGYINILDKTCKDLLAEGVGRLSEDKLRTLKLTLDATSERITKSQVIHSVYKIEMSDLLTHLNRVLRFLPATKEQFEESIAVLQNFMSKKCCNEQRNPEFLATFHKLLDISGKYDFDQPSDRLAFASNYIAYLKILTGALEEDTTYMFEEAKAEVNRLEKKMETLVGSNKLRDLVGNEIAAWWKHFSFTAPFALMDPSFIAPLGVVSEAVISSQVKKLFPSKAPSAPALPRDVPYLVGNEIAAWWKHFSFTAPFALMDPSFIAPLGVVSEAVISSPVISSQVKKLFPSKAPSAPTPPPYVPLVDSDSGTDSGFDSTDSDADDELDSDSTARRQPSKKREAPLSLEPLKRKKVWNENPWYSATQLSSTGRLMDEPIPNPSAIWDPWSVGTSSAAQRLASLLFHEPRRTLAQIAADFKKASKKKDEKAILASREKLESHVLYNDVRHHYTRIMAEWGNKDENQQGSLMKAMEEVSMGLVRE